MGKLVTLHSMMFLCLDLQHPQGEQSNFKGWFLPKGYQFVIPVDDMQVSRESCMV